ncbi:MAG: fibronectin type III domain-containing protein, partial [Calditrichaeota bacterium]
MRKLKLFCIDFLFILLVFLFLLPDIGAQPATFDSITITSPSPGSTQSGTFDITAKTEGTGVSNGPFFYWASTGNQINGSIELTYLDDDDNGIYDGIEYIISFESATFIHGLATNLNLIVRAFGGSPGQWREHTIQINVDNRTCDEMPNLLSPADDYEFPYGVTLPGFQWSASLNQNCTEEYVIKFMVRDYWNNWVTFCLIPTGTNTSYNYSSSACNYILAKDVEYRWSVGIRSNGVNNYSGAQIRSFKLKNISSPVLSSADGSSNSGEINISFNSVSGAQGYKLYYDDDNTGDYTGTGATGGSSPISLSTSQTNYTISGLDAGKTYYFAVKAVDGANWSDYSNEKYATTSGTINANQTWPGSGNPSTLTINGNITVASGVTLTVSPGSTVKFASGKYLKAYGTLDAQGTSSNNITFTSSGSSWGGIQISGGSASSSELEYCTIQNAGIGIDVSNSSPLIKKCYIYSCSSYPLKLTSGATPKVLDNKFYAGSTHSVYISSA